jgi:O-antigen/teichoic acid export membrane protein
LSGAGNRQACLILATLLVPFQWYTYVVSALTTEERFPSAARVQGLQAVLALLFMIPLASLWGLWGAVAAQALAYITACISMRHGVPLLERPEMNRELAGEQVRIGMPVGLNGIVNTLYVTLDRTMVASSLGVAALGQYALTTLARSSIGLVPSAVSEVVYMRTSTVYGGSGSIDSVVPLVRVDQTVASLTAPVIGLAVIWAAPGVSLLMPKYSEGVPALQVFLVGLFFMFPQYAGILLIAIGRARRLLLLQCAGLGVEAVLLALALRWNGSLESIAAATAFSSGFLFLAITLEGLRVARVGARRIGSHVMRVLAPFALMGAGIGAGRFAAGYVGATMGTMPSAAIQSVVFVILNCVTIFAAIRTVRTGGID